MDRVNPDIPVYVKSQYLAYVGFRINAVESIKVNAHKRVGMICSRHAENARCGNTSILLVPLTIGLSTGHVEKGKSISTNSLLRLSELFGELQTALLASVGEVDRPARIKMFFPHVMKRIS
jgi:hypothetical protein